MTAPLLELRGLERHYGRGGGAVAALAGVDLVLEAGSIFGIVGESGSGKSTLARLVMGFDRPTAGTVLVDGQDLHRGPARRLRELRRGLQMVFQDPQGSLDPSWTIGAIVAEPLYRDASAAIAATRRARVVEALTAVGLSADDLPRRPHEFSGGQRQRIAIARAIVAKPRLIVADEPVSALDPSVQAQVLNLLMDLREREGIAVLVITHSLAVVGALADRIGVMQAGRFVETGPAADLLLRPRHPFTQRLVEAEPRLDAPPTRMSRP